MSGTHSLPCQINVFTERVHNSDFLIGVQHKWRNMISETIWKGVAYFKKSWSCVNTRIIYHLLMMKGKGTIINQGEAYVKKVCIWDISFQSFCERFEKYISFALVEYLWSVQTSLQRNINRMENETYMVLHLPSHQHPLLPKDNEKEVFLK